MTAIEYSIETVDILEFYKLLIDFVVHGEQKHGAKLEEFPVTDSGEAYFYPFIERVSSQGGARSTGTIPGAKTTKQLDLALTEIFNFYARKFTVKPSDFAHMQD